MLHAFILGRNEIEQSYTTIYDGTSGKSIGSPALGVSSDLGYEGTEIWAFMPKGAMRNIHTLADFGVQSKLNVSPVVAEVKFPDKDGSGEEWRNILIGGFREAGRGYYALDVTEPWRPKLIWEIDNLWQEVTTNIPYPSVNDSAFDGLTSSEEASYKSYNHYPFARLGLSYPEAVITNMLIDSTDGKGNTKTYSEPVAILPGGKPLPNVSGEDLTGRALYIVRLNPKTKEDVLVAQFQFDSPITGTPAVFPAGFNTNARLIYVGDENGALHRIDISNLDKDKWTINGQETKRSGTNNKIFEVNDTQGVVPIFDPVNITSGLNPDHGKFERITYKPAVNALTTSGYPDIQIAFGSGDSSIDDNSGFMNYAAVFIDHHVNDEIGYQLNNFNPDSKSDAYTQNIKPVVIVFNPTTNVKSADAKSYEMPIGSVNKKQYFEIIAGTVPSNDLTDPEPPAPYDPGKCDSRCTLDLDHGCSIANYSGKNDNCLATSETKECYDPNFLAVCVDSCKYQHNKFSGKEGCYILDGYGGYALCSGCETRTISTTMSCDVSQWTSVLEVVGWLVSGGFWKLITGQTELKDAIAELKKKCSDYKYLDNGTCYSQVEYDVDSCTKAGCCDDKSKSRSARERSGSSTELQKIAPRQKMMGAALTYNFRTYFPTYNAPANDSTACNSGYSSIWLVNSLTNQKFKWGTMSNNLQNSSNVSSISGATDGGKEASGLDPSKRASFVNLANGTKVYALTMTPQMACLGNKTVTYAAPMLVAQTGESSGTSGGYNSGSDANMMGGSMFNEDGSRKQGGDVAVLAITEEAITPETTPLSWGSVYE